MNRYIKQTEVWEHRPDGRRILINTITHGSRFHGFKVPAEGLHTEEAQLWVAREVKSGWDMNGPYRGVYRYEIEQLWSDGDRVIVH